MNVLLWIYAFILLSAAGYMQYYKIGSANPRMMLSLLLGVVALFLILKPFWCQHIKLNWTSVLS